MVGLCRGDRGIAPGKASAGDQAGEEGCAGWKVTGVLIAEGPAICFIGVLLVSAEVVAAIFRAGERARDETEDKMACSVGPNASVVVRVNVSAALTDGSVAIRETSFDALDDQKRSKHLS